MNRLNSDLRFEDKIYEKKSNHNGKEFKLSTNTGESVQSYVFHRNRNRKLQTSKAPLKSQAQGTSLFTSAALNQRGFAKNSPWEAQVRLPKGERRQIRR